MESPTEKYYEKYKHLAEKYAAKVFNYSKLGYEKEDVVQEFRIKIYTTILAYARRWKKYREQGRYKPVDIQTYIKSALANKVKDFIKVINEVPNEISIEDASFDFGTEVLASFQLSVKKLECSMNGVNLTKGLDKTQTIVFIMYLKGYSVDHIKKLYRGVNVVSLIRNRKKFLEQYREQLCEVAERKYFETRSFE